MSVTGWGFRFLLIPIIAIALVALPVAFGAENGRLAGSSLAVAEDQTIGEEEVDNVPPCEFDSGRETSLDFRCVLCAKSAQGPQIDIDFARLKKHPERGPPRG